MNKPAIILSLFSGYGGLDLAVEHVFENTKIIAMADNDTGPNAVLAHHWPNTPNLNDITTIDWTSVGHVDVMTGGFCCQSVSTAGKRAGLKQGTRTGLWFNYAQGISILHPSLVIAENVGGLLSAASVCDEDDRRWTERAQRRGVRPSGHGDSLDASGSATPVNWPWDEVHKPWFCRPHARSRIGHAGTHHVFMRTTREETAMSITIETCKDIDRLAALVKQGVSLTYMPEGDEDDYHHFRFAEGIVRVKSHYISLLFETLNATVNVGLRGDVLTFTPQGLDVNGKRHVKFKYEQDMVYHLQKTQYKGASPYGLLSVLVDPFWEHVVSDQLTKTGWLAMA